MVTALKKLIKVVDNYALSDWIIFAGKLNFLCQFFLNYLKFYITSRKWDIN